MKIIRSLGIALLSVGTSFAISSKAMAVMFYFSFTNVDGNTPGTVIGTIDGLLDNTANQKTGITVTVTSSPLNSGSLTTYEFASGIPYPFQGFTVSGGNIVDWDWVGNATSPGYQIGFGKNANQTYLSGIGQQVNSNVANTNFSQNPIAPTAVPFEFSPTLGIITFGTLLGASRLHKKFRVKKLAD